MSITRPHSVRGFYAAIYRLAVDCRAKRQVSAERDLVAAALSMSQERHVFLDLFLDLFLGLLFLGLLFLGLLFLGLLFLDRGRLRSPASR